jgi:ribosomal protein S18 acetylase RimI-like enzyme
VIHYRTFHNDDPPGLVRVWNEAFTGRGAVALPTPSALEEYVFAKPYFDPAGLVFALDDGQHVGFAHAGFGPGPHESSLSVRDGVVCALGVRPSYRGRGIGTELLRRCEAYLSERGSTNIYAGPMPPLNPFYLGLYGGSESAGFLSSDAAAEPFLLGRGYLRHDAQMVWQRRLEGPINVADPRFLVVRRRFELVAQPRRGACTWWRECVLGPIEVLDVLLRDKMNGQVVARAAAWEMLGFCQRWGAPAVGVIDLEVREDLRCQGLAKFVIVHLLRHVQEQFFSLVEVQTNERNEAAVRLYRGLGFEQVDTGRSYRKAEGPLVA